MGANRSRPRPAHRENTRASFNAAARAGADWVELDLLPSADGDLMIQHNHFIKVDNVKRPVWEVPTSRLIELGVEPLDGLDADLPAGLGLYLELKVAAGDADPDRGPESFDTLRHWMTATQSSRPLLGASFDPFVAVDLHCSGLPSAWITGVTPTFLTTVTAAVRAGLPLIVVQGEQLDAPDHQLAVAFDLARRNDLTIWCWGPRLDRLPHLRELGVEGFCVDDITAARSAVCETAAVA